MIDIPILAYAIPILKNKRYIMLSLLPHGKEPAIVTIRLAIQVLPARAQVREVEQGLFGG